MPENKEVILRVFDNIIDAELAKGHLDAEGISSVIHRIEEAGFKTIMIGAHGIQLIVRAPDKDAAEETLKAMGV